jgi:hypothetical protein
MKKISLFNRQASLCEIAIGMHHSGFLLVLEMPSSLTCKDIHNNTVSVIHLLEIATATATATATAESNTHMCYSTVSRNSQIDSITPAFTRQHHNSLMRSK